MSESMAHFPPGGSRMWRLKPHFAPLLPTFRVGLALPPSLTLSLPPFLPSFLPPQPKSLTLPDLPYGYSDLEPVISGGKRIGGGPKGLLFCLLPPSLPHSLSFFQRAGRRNHGDSPQEAPPSLHHQLQRGRGQAGRGRGEERRFRHDRLAARTPSLPSSLPPSFPPSLPPSFPSSLPPFQPPSLRASFLLPSRNFLRAIFSCWCPAFPIPPSLPNLPLLLSSLSSLPLTPGAPL